MTVWQHFRTKSTVKHSLKFYLKKVFVSHPDDPAVDLRGALPSRDTLDHLLWGSFFVQPPLQCVFWRVRHVCVSVRSVLPRAGWEWWRLRDWQRPRADAGADTGGRDGDRPCRFAFARCWSVESTLRKSSRCSLTFLCWSFFSLDVTASDVFTRLTRGPEPLRPLRAEGWRALTFDLAVKLTSCNQDWNLVLPSFQAMNDFFFSVQPKGFLLRLGQQRSRCWKAQKKNRKWQWVLFGAVWSGLGGIFGI